MIKILKEGKIPQCPYYKAKCGHCKTEYYYQDEDVNSYPIWISECVFVYTICPLCNCKVRVHSFRKKYFLK